MYKNHAEDILALLEGIAAVRSVTRGWPEAFDKLPCLAVSEAANAPADKYDDMEYSTGLEYYVRIFSRDSAAGDAIAAEVDRLMVQAGWERSLVYEDDNPDVRQRVMRYGKEV